MKWLFFEPEKNENKLTVAVTPRIKLIQVYEEQLINLYLHSILE